MISRWLKRGAVGLVVALVVIQVIPYGRVHRNPGVIAEPAWSSPEVRALAVRACFDCHSNQVKWPWYSHVAPVSWLVQHDVDEGRAVLNFSQWNQPWPEAGESSETVAEGEMPPRPYLLLHPEARLSPTEKQQLIDGLAATLGTQKDDDEERATAGR